MLKLISGGHFRKKGYDYCIYITFPSISTSTTIDISKKEYKCTKILFDSGFLFTRSPSYVNIAISVLGFGFGLEIKLNNGEVNG